MCIGTMMTCITGFQTRVHHSLRNRHHSLSQPCPFTWNSVLDGRRSRKVLGRLLGSSLELTWTVPLNRLDPMSSEACVFFFFSSWYDPVFWQDVKLRWLAFPFFFFFLLQVCPWHWDGGQHATSDTLHVRHVCLLRHQYLGRHLIHYASVRCSHPADWYWVLRYSGEYFDWLVISVATPICMTVTLLLGTWYYIIGRRVSIVSVIMLRLLLDTKLFGVGGGDVVSRLSDDASLRRAQ